MSGTTKRRPREATRIDVDQARELIDGGAVVVDVLPAPTYRKNHIPGAVNRPLSEMNEDRMADIALDAPIVVYCFDQRCDLSARASARLVHMGYTKVHDLIGGRAAWTVLGFPTEGSEADRRSVGAHVDTVASVDADATIADLPASAAGEAVPVVDGHGVLLGAVDRVASSRARDTPVTAVMVPAPGTIRPDMVLDDALQQLRDDGLSYTFVSTARGELLGVLRRDAHV